MNSYSQRDPKWADQKLGSSNQNLGRVGCTTTCIADLSTYFGDNLDPLSVSKICQYTSDGLLLWASAKFPNFEFTKREYGRNDANIKQAVSDPNRAVILQVSNGSHWVVATGYDLFGRLKIADPFFGDFASITRYKNDITGAAYFQGKTSPVQTKISLRIARIGTNLPLISELQAQVDHFTSGRIQLVPVDYNVPLANTGMIDQATAYGIVDTVQPSPTFLQFYYTSPNAPFAMSYSYPKRKKYISTIPTTNSFIAAFEFSHCLQYYCNDVLHAQIQIEDSNYPDDSFTQRKYDTVKPYLDRIGGVLQ